MKKYMFSLVSVGKEPRDKQIEAENFEDAKLAILKSGFLGDLFNSTDLEVLSVNNQFIEKDNNTLSCFQMNVL